MNVGLDQKDWNVLDELLAKANIQQKERMAIKVIDNMSNQINSLIKQGRLHEVRNQ
jgi:hypothetical protein